MSFNWQDKLHTVISAAQTVDGYIAKGLDLLRTNPEVGAFIKAVPALEPFAGKLLAMIPVVGEVAAGLELANLIVSNAGALMALGAAWHFAPEDARNGVIAGKPGDVPWS